MVIALAPCVATTMEIMLAPCVVTFLSVFSIHSSRFTQSSHVPGNWVVSSTDHWICDCVCHDAASAGSTSRRHWTRCCCCYCGYQTCSNLNCLMCLSEFCFYSVGSELMDRRILVTAQVTEVPDHLHVNLMLFHGGSCQAVLDKVGQCL